MNAGKRLAALFRKVDARYSKQDWIMENESLDLRVPVGQSWAILGC